MNPLRFKKLPPSPPVVAAVIVHLPYIAEYHMHRFEIVKRSLETLRDGSANEDRSILIWDNGSCREMRDWLLDYDPDTLIFSPNVGKSSARKAIFGMLPLDKIVAIADDDMHYEDKWLTKQLAVLNHFPPAVVSGYPTRFGFKYNTQHTQEWAKKHGKVTYGKFISPEHDWQFARSIGMQQPTWNDIDDTLIEYNGMKAYATSHHCQFVTRVRDLVNIVEFDNQGSADEHPFDQKIDDAGLLRLATVERTAYHLGNVLDD